MEDKAKEQFLEQVFVTHVAPNLPDRVLNDEQIFLGGQTYTLRRTAGVGSFAVLHQYAPDQGRPIAIKAQKKPNFRGAIGELRNHFYAQGRTLNSAARGITPLLGVIWTERGLLIALEYVSGGTYQQLENKLTQAIRKGLITDAKLLAAIHVTALRDAAKGLAKANANNVLHDDMHRQNLVFKEGKGLVCDFGYSQVFDDAQVNSTSFNSDAIRLGFLVRSDHPGFDREPPEVFENHNDVSGSPAALLTDAQIFFKENGAGGPHVRAVIDTLAAWDEEDDARVIAARDAYLEASDAVTSGRATWRDMKSAYRARY
jgi:hypothetical protein